MMPLVYMGFLRKMPSQFATHFANWFAICENERELMPRSLKLQECSVRGKVQAEQKKGHLQLA